MRASMRSSDILRVIACLFLTSAALGLTAICWFSGNGMVGGGEEREVLWRLGPTDASAVEDSGNSTVRR